MKWQRISFLNALPVTLQIKLGGTKIVLGTKFQPLRDSNCKASSLKMRGSIIWFLLLAIFGSFSWKLTVTRALRLRHCCRMQFGLELTVNLQSLERIKPTSLLLFHKCLRSKNRKITSVEPTAAQGKHCQKCLNSYQQVQHCKHS